MRFQKQPKALLPRKGIRRPSQSHALLDVPQVNEMSHCWLPAGDTLRLKPGVTLIHEPCPIA